MELILIILLIIVLFGGLGPWAGDRGPYIGGGLGLVLLVVLIVLLIR